MGNGDGDGDGAGDGDGNGFSHWFVQCTRDINGIE